MPAENLLIIVTITFTQNEVEKIRKEYKNLVHNRCAEILSVTRILRVRIENPNLSKNADFSVNGFFC
jgi:hypothetical protein